MIDLTKTTDLENTFRGIAIEKENFNGKEFYIPATFTNNTFNNVITEGKFIAVYDHPNPVHIISEISSLCQKMNSRDISYITFISEIEDIATKFYDENIPQ